MILLAVVGMLIYAMPRESAHAAKSPSQPIVLDTLSPLASAQETVSRMLSPVTQQRIARFTEKKALSLQAQVIEKGEEPFELYVPPPDPNRPYGLLVYIWPADDIQVPPGWWNVLRDRHMIYIAARRSGNDENIFDRRVPLALHGYEYVRSRYALDPERVYIGGFSGGSRTAQRTAMAYPDIFRGMLLAGGSDALGGDSGFTFPSEPLTRLLQQRSRIVFSTGGEDTLNRSKDARTRKNFDLLCLRNVSVVPQPGIQHWVPDGRGFARAIEQLEAPPTVDTAPNTCDARLQGSIDTALAEVQARLDKGDLEGASTRLAKLDAEYGGLAAPRSVALADTIAMRAGWYTLP